jgi:hypothetical protein
VKKSHDPSHIVSAQASVQLSQTDPTRTVDGIDPPAASNSTRSSGEGPAGLSGSLARTSAAYRPRQFSSFQQLTTSSAVMRTSTCDSTARRYRFGVQQPYVVSANPLPQNHEQKPGDSVNPSQHPIVSNICDGASSPPDAVSQLPTSTIRLPDGWGGSA